MNDIMADRPLLFLAQKLENMRKDLLRIFQTRVEKTPAFKHATDVPVYFNNSEERVMEYDFDSIVFEADSPYQNIKILHSPTLGNCLILDDLQNLGDCDLRYTHALMKYGQISYAGKEILILGGGDGGLLHELLKEKPKFVTLVDIDLMVIEACRRHLRLVCGDSLDSFTGPNHQILVEDCFKIMDQYIQEGRKFDIIFNDLTDIPIMTSPQGEQWQLVNKIVSMAFKLLKPNGRYLNHAIGITVKEALNKYEQLLSNHQLGFSQHTAYVPSFLETWTFYEVWKLDNNSPNSCSPAQIGSS